MERLIMSLIPTKPNSAHWYHQTPEGVWMPMYEMPKKDGKGMKKVTLREAREGGFVPSVTGITEMMPKPFLQSWKVEQAILSAVTLPRLPDETEDAFCARVVEDMDAQSEKAREFGTKIHDAIESYLMKRHEPFPDDVAPFMASFVQWADNEIMEVKALEFCVGSKVCGYAGRLDLDAVLMGRGPCLVDFKTQKVKLNRAGIKEPAFYLEWPIQLTAYANAMPEKRGLVTVVIDSGEPGPIWLREWVQTERLKYWSTFESLYKVWVYLNNYDPSKARIYGLN
jgi:hypothetical protein